MAFLDNPFSFGISKVEMFVDDNDLTDHITKWNSFLDTVFGDDKDVTLPSRSCVNNTPVLKYADSVFEFIPRGKFKPVVPSVRYQTVRVATFDEICKRNEEAKLMESDSIFQHSCDVDLRNGFVRELSRSMKRARMKVNRYSSLKVSILRESENVFFPSGHGDLFELKCHELSGKSAEYVASTQRPPSSSVFLVSKRALDKPRTGLGSFHTRTGSTVEALGGTTKQHNRVGYDIDCRNRFFVLSDEFCSESVTE